MEDNAYGPEAHGTSGTAPRPFQATDKLTQSATDHSAPFPAYERHQERESRHTPRRPLAHSDSISENEQDWSQEAASTSFSPCKGKRALDYAHANFARKARHEHDDTRQSKATSAPDLDESGTPCRTSYTHGWSRGSGGWPSGKQRHTSANRSDRRAWNRTKNCSWNRMRSRPQKSIY